MPGFYVSTFIGGNNYGALATKLSVVTGQWYHVVGTRTASGALSIYVNGTLAATGSDSGAPVNNVSAGVAVSASGDGSGREPFNGTIDEAAVYPVALSATQVSNEIDDSPANPITGYTKHGINQAISSDEHGVCTQAILDAVNNPIATELQQGAQGPTTLYQGQNAVVVLNQAGKS